MFIADSLYYGKPTLTPFNFLRTNLSSVSLFYGKNPWHYYVSQAIPVLLTTALPFTLHGIWITITSKSPRNIPLRTLLITIIWTVGVYSLAGHKEWRFLHPILPLLYIFAAKSIVDSSFSQQHAKRDLKSAADPRASRAKIRPQTLTAIHRQFHLSHISKKYLYLLLATVPISLYIILFYCSAPISVLSYIRSIAQKELDKTTIGVLMPCHSLPGDAYVHREKLAHGRMWALGCEPPLESVLRVYVNQWKLIPTSCLGTKTCRPLWTKRMYSSNRPSITCRHISRSMSIQTFLYRLFPRPCLGFLRHLP
jgi:phosphatidylinositol glycan class B